MKVLHRKKDSNLVYPSARNNDHGGSDDVVLVQIPGDIQIPILIMFIRVSSVAQKPSLSCRLKALSERKVLVPIPAPKSRNLMTPPEVVLYSQNTTS